MWFFCLPCQDLQDCSLPYCKTIKSDILNIYMHTYIHTFLHFVLQCLAYLSEIPCLSTTPEWRNMNTLAHTTRLLLQACTHVLVCLYGQHMEESNAVEMLWWWLTQFKLVGKVATGLSDFFTVPAKRIEGTTRADQQTYEEKRK